MQSSPAFSHREMEDAFAARDRAADGRFVVGVTSTGIYCRPSCPARRPRPEHVRFFATGLEARAAGLRACRRCLPDDVARDDAAVAQALAMLEEAGGTVLLAQLGAATGYSPTHFSRVFARATGLSPAAYGRALRIARAGVALSREGRVTDAIYAAGYGAASNFYDDMKGNGMKPSEWRDGGKGRRVHHACFATTLGPLLVAATDAGVCCVAFNETEADLRARFPRATLVAAGEEFRDLFARVLAAVEQPGTGADIPLDVRGTAFQAKVWQQLRQIPPGETISYGELAARIGQPKACRAVGGANGANAVAVLIPCHRVIAADGSLGGYAYGLEIKAELLRRERGGA